MLKNFYQIQVFAFLFTMIGIGHAPNLAQASENIGPAHERLIRVRTLSHLKEINIEGAGVSFNQISKFMPVAIPRQKKIKIQVQDGQFVINDFSQQDSKNSVQPGPFLSLKGSDIHINGIPQPQDLLISIANQKIDVVALLPLENYLVGVLAGEMPLHWPMETLKAQAIVARSYAQSVMKERAKKLFHVESSFMDQVFKFSKISDEKRRRAQQAVFDTQGLVLSDPEMRLVKTFFHSDCGGQTSNAKDVWGGSVATETVTDSYCQNNKNSGWKVYFSDQDIAQRLISNKKAKIDRLEFVQSLKDQRVKAVKIYQVKEAQKNSEKDIVVSLSGNQFREKLGYGILRSTKFKFQRTSAGYYFMGQGYGHGVGLCQHGARRLGERGLNAMEILKHYYPQAKLKDISQIDSMSRTAQKL